MDLQEDYQCAQEQQHSFDNNDDKKTYELVIANIILLKIIYYGLSI